MVTHDQVFDALKQVNDPELAERLFAISGVSGLLISHDRVNPGPTAGALR